MSGQFSSAIMFFSILAIAFAAGRAEDAEAPAARGPAAVGMKTEMKTKQAILGAGRTAPILRHTEKLRGPLNVRLELIGAKPAVGDVFVLHGIVTSREALSSADFQWSLPVGVELINGALSGNLGLVSNDQPAIVELTLKKVSNDNAQVHLMAGALRGGARFADSAQFNTDTQEALDAHKERMKKATRDEANSRQELKVFH